MTLKKLRQNTAHQIIGSLERIAVMLRKYDVWYDRNVKGSNETGWYIENPDNGFRISMCVDNVFSIVFQTGKDTSYIYQSTLFLLRSPFEVCEELVDDVIQQLPTEIAPKLKAHNVHS